MPVVQHPPGVERERVFGIKLFAGVAVGGGEKQPAAARKILAEQIWAAGVIEARARPVDAARRDSCELGVNGQLSHRAADAVTGSSPHRTPTAA